MVTYILIIWKEDAARARWSLPVRWRFHRLFLRLGDCFVHYVKLVRKHGGRRRRVPGRIARGRRPVLAKNNRPNFDSDELWRPIRDQFVSLCCWNSQQQEWLRPA